MNTKQLIAVIIVLLMVLVILVQGASQSLEPIAEPTLTKTIIPTVKSTRTKAPTKPSRPTPTLPIDVPKPQGGNGVVFGQIINGRIPASDMEVRLCSKYIDSSEGVCGTGVKYKTITDSNGFFVFNEVTPGRYEVLVVLLPEMYIKYWTFKIDIKAEETINLGSIDIK